MVTIKTIRDHVIQAFESNFKAQPAYLTRSPGRVNLIGEHTDYNQGFVLPMTIGFAVWAAGRPRLDSRVILHSLDLGERLEFDLSDLSRGKKGWKEYITGVAWALQEEGHELKGWEGVFSGDVPIGAGLSSSAALELASARAFALSSGIEWDPAKMARLCQKAENDWVGINSGIMDQLISACGKEGSALLIDCRSLETREIPLPDGAQFVILDTATRRGLVDSAYNERRDQCEAVACHFEVESLRELNLERLGERAGVLNLELYRRARHVITANLRALEGAKALEANDPSRFGELMNESHLSMKDDFEISRKEMDLMVEIAQGQPGCYGARMTGGGFGGCAVALVSNELVGSFNQAVVEEYREKTGLEAKAYAAAAVEGTSWEKI